MVTSCKRACNENRRFLAVAGALFVAFTGFWPAAAFAAVFDVREHGAAGAYVRATDTISEGKDGFVTAIPERSGLYYTQTPQAFRYEVIMDAHRSARERNRVSSTDDAGMVLDAGGRVRSVEGDYRNIKITSPADYEAAKALASRGLEA